VGDGATKHVFQAHRLGGELEVVVQPLALGAMFEFDRVRRAIGEKFHHVTFSNQASAV
jgi:hypothetical protein